LMRSQCASVSSWRRIQGPPENRFHFRVKSGFLRVESLL
jgi:hypothetical protein